MEYREKSCRGLSTLIQGRLIHFRSISTCPCHSSLGLVFQSLFSKQVKDNNFPSIFLEASCCMISGKVREWCLLSRGWEWVDSDLLLDRRMDSAGPSTHSSVRGNVAFHHQLDFSAKPSPQNKSHPQMLKSPWCLKSTIKSWEN